MATQEQVNNYLNNHYEGMGPKQLILLLYKGALDHLKLAMEGIKEHNIQKRGENISKVIAIISELNASIDPTMTDESTLFLRSLYNAILMELPKVALTNDIKILQRSDTYIVKLKEIWEKDVMAKDNDTRKSEVKQRPKQDASLAAAFKNNQESSKKTTFNSIAV